MIDGIYQITFRGAADWGVGMLVLRRGMVVGADVGGVEYDGSYTTLHGDVRIHMKLTVPPGTTLVQGSKAQSRPYEFSFKSVVPERAFLTAEPVLVNMPPGPVNVIFRRLRTLSD